MTAEELLTAAGHCTLCGTQHPERPFSDHRGHQHVTTDTDHKALPLDPLTMTRLRKLIPVTVSDKPRAARPRARKGGDKP